MFRIVFCVTLIAYQTSTWGLKHPWFDDIDGPKFLRGAEKQTKEERELDSTYDSPHDWAEVVREDFVTKVPSQHESIIFKVTPHPDGINTSRWNQSAISALGHSMQSDCGPYPTVVELHKDPGVQLLPPAIKLSRCVGGCTSSQLFQNCTVKSQQEIVISVFEMIGGNNQPKTITVYNHTECECGCMTRSSDCDDTIQNYDPNTCSCTCIEDASSCDPAKQIWNSHSCQCECNNALICDATANHVWNDATCDCDCKQQVKDRCVRKNKVLNTSTCECDCPTPLPTCDAGESFLKHNCSCV